MALGGTVDRSSCAILCVPVAMPAKNAMKKTKRKLLTIEERNRRISQGLKLAWARRKRLALGGTVK